MVGNHLLTTDIPTGPMHIVYFVQYDTVSFMTLYPIQQEEGVDTGAFLWKKGWIQWHILGEITDLEFENH